MKAPLDKKSPFDLGLFENIMTLQGQWESLKRMCLYWNKSTDDIRGLKHPWKNHCGQKTTYGTEGKDSECFNCNKLFSIIGQKWISCNGCAKWAHINCYDHSGDTFVKKNWLWNAAKLSNKQKLVNHLLKWLFWGGKMCWSFYLSIFIQWQKSYHFCPNSLLKLQVLLKNKIYLYRNGYSIHIKKYIYVFIYIRIYNYPKIWDQ